MEFQERQEERVCRSSFFVFFKATFVIFSGVVLDVDHDFSDYDDGQSDPTG